MIPGWLVALLTFPGVICHEIAHRFFCDLCGVPVYAVSYVRIGNPAGYVIHSPVKSLKSALLISIGPLIVNTVLCSLICFSAVIPVFILKDSETRFASGLLLWIGISIGMHSFPSNTDMDSFIKVLENAGSGGFLLGLGKLFGGLFRIANSLRFIWFDAIYSLIIAFLLPWLVLGIW